MYGRYLDCKGKHDWAFQDFDTFMVKVCLRCGAEQFFFPEEVDYEPDLDDHRTEKI